MNEKARRGEESKTAGHPQKKSLFIKHVARGS